MMRRRRSYTPPKSATHSAQSLRLPIIEKYRFFSRPENPLTNDYRFVRSSQAFTKMSKCLKTHPEPQSRFFCLLFLSPQVTQKRVGRDTFSCFPVWRVCIIDTACIPIKSRASRITNAKRQEKDAFHSNIKRILLSRY